MIEVFGDFIEHFPPEQDSLEITFTPTSIPLKQRWRNNRLSAHFLADYFTTFLPLDDNLESQKLRIKESKEIVTFIANELLENAMKYNDVQSDFQVQFGIHFLDEEDLTAVIFAVNSITQQHNEKLKYFINTLFSSDPEMMYIEQIEKNALTNEDCSGLGFLTMINDYSAKLGWKFDTLINEKSCSIITVTTMVQIVV